eukprot:gb/GEZN01020337.1/.p1 GENE.gb/GEZN01020337.1/~~gb/GEZN01020337.1/.p1  ORF type:complete len:106 (+),score=13.73 gb/GEZN01020337.1/:328-645(+)
MAQHEHKKIHYPAIHAAIVQNLNTVKFDVAVLKIFTREAETSEFSFEWLSQQESVRNATTGWETVLAGLYQQMYPMLPMCDDAPRMANGWKRLAATMDGIVRLHL